MSLSDKALLYWAVVWVAGSAKPGRLLPRKNLSDPVQAGLWGSQMRDVAPTHPQRPPALPPESSVVPVGHPAQDQKGRTVAHGGFGVGALTVLGGFKNV